MATHCTHEYAARDHEGGIDAVGIEKRFGDRVVLAGVDLHVPPGTVHALLGPNGAGKTTIVRILSTLTRADGGHARVAGFDVSTQPHEVRRRISLTGQSAAVDEKQTGVENLRTFARLSGHSRRSAACRAAALLERFGLVEDADQLVGSYSGGMRRRLDLAAGLVAAPQVVFLDEPTTGLDPRSRAAVWDAATTIAADGAAILLTTQYLDEADRLASRVTLIDGGRVKASGTPSELKQRVAGHRLELEASDDHAFDQMVAVLGARVIEVDRRRLCISVSSDANAGHVRELLDEIDPTRRGLQRFAVREASLDDVFFALTGGPPLPEPTREPAVTNA